MLLKFLRKKKRGGCVEKNPIFDKISDVPTFVPKLISGEISNDGRLMLWAERCWTPESYRTMEENYKNVIYVLSTQYGHSIYTGDGPINIGGKSLLVNNKRVNNYAYQFTVWEGNNTIIILSWDQYSDTTAIHLAAIKHDKYELVNLVLFEEKYKNEEHGFAVGKENVSGLYYISLEVREHCFKDYEITKKMYDDCPNNLEELIRYSELCKNNQMEHKFLITGKDGRICTAT